MFQVNYRLLVLLAVSACVSLPVSADDPVGSQAETIVAYSQRTAERLDLARRTLAYVEASVKQPQLAAELAAMEKRVESAAASPDTFPKSLYDEACNLRRRIILSHPKLDFDRLLINKRPPPGFNHQSDQYLGRYSGVGDGLVVLESWKDQPRETVLLKDQLPAGSVLHPDLSFDARRILFSYCDHTPANPTRRRFFVYEIGIDGSGLRQVTGTEQDTFDGSHGRETVLIEDWDACYLPDGGFAFVSTRNQGGVRCHFGDRYCPTYTLYRGELDGTGIQPMAYGEANEWDPSVMHDGSIIWTRWDYINRHDTLFQSLWTTRPDGTSPEHFYGNYTRNPCSIAEARAIPGSRKVVATATAHHSYTAGSIIVIDPYRGQDGQEPITRITPETAFPETEGWADSAYATPWPINEDLFLVAYSAAPHTSQGKNRAANDYAIYLVDTLGGRELIYRDESMSSFCPIPIQPRPTPPALPSLARSNSDVKDASGVFYVQNVYDGPAELEQGSVKSLRVVRVDSQTTQTVPPRSKVLFETAKKILGTVPVAEDGSVAFRVPAGESLLFQLLDDNGMAVMGMRSFTYVHPGETVSCVGCHAPPNAPSVSARNLNDLTVHDLRPPVGPKYDGGLSFARTVQPVLDRYCISCHGLDQTAGDLNLLGTIEDRPADAMNVLASTAYNSLVSRDRLVAMALRNLETDASLPKDYFSHAGRLAGMLLNGDDHHEKLDPESRQRVVDWLDLNAQFFGDYSWNKVEWRQPDPEGESTLREHIRENFGAELAKQPYASLVNVGEPTESRILQAPLATTAGGWGQIAHNGWLSTNDAGYARMWQLVEQSIKPLATHDIDGTCGQQPCVCGSCWVRHASEPTGPPISVDAADAVGRPIPTERYTLARVDSENTDNYDGRAVNAFDGNPATMWHTQFSGASPAHPHELVIDLGAEYNVAGFLYLPRGGNGDIGHCEFYVSSDPNKFERPQAKGQLRLGEAEQAVNIVPTRGRYVLLRALSEANGQPWSSIPELRILGLE
ncbi:MAG TPA: discoidin domain-containing protein [Planctomycetaceae bacterium]|nr:discoidin domain-containing protein [Planctomycetaceae bacterium]